MANLAQLRDRVDAFVAARWPTIIARMENFRTNRGRYWQGVRTHSIIPQHTNSTDGDSIPDRLTQNTSDNLDNWANVFPEWLSEPIPCAVRIDVYNGPQGEGWSATIYINFNGVIYYRTQNVGPESGRTHGWREDIEP